jgi:spore maturation protein CgeB
MSQVLRDRFGTGASYCHFLNALGWDAQLIVPNSLRLQSAWVRENLKRSVLSFGWKYALHISRLPFLSLLARLPHVHWALVQQARLLRPDVIYVQDLNLLSRRLVRRLSKFASTVVGEIASPLPPKRFLDGYDFVFSALPSVVERLIELGISSASLPLGFDPRNLTERGETERDIDLVFVGSFYSNQPDTFEMLKRAKEEVPGLRIYGPSGYGVLSSHGLGDNYYGEAWGAEMFELLKRSKIVLNRHGAIAGNYAVNMRMFETTGMGALLITEAKENLAEFFEPGEEVITYRTPDEAATVAADLLRNPGQLSQIASAGQQRTLTSHSYSHRMQLLSDKLKDLLSAARSR